MTQQEQQGFRENLDGALCWMRTVQERLKANDNTQGPLHALEARLRETEKIHQSEHEGRVKVDMALASGEQLLQSGDEELRNDTLAKLKEVKSQWEETSTYIVHCHSRVEWVWLHWSEYLKALQEFEVWLRKQQRALEVGLELQLGVREKLWQVDQQQVVLSDIHGQAALLQRLLDEADALHNRTQDASVDAQAQERLRGAYNQVKDKAQERLSVLRKMAEEHQMYLGGVQKFQSWLLSKTKELTALMEREETSEDKLRALRALDDSVASEERTLQHLEGVAEAVRANTSPAGAEEAVEEAEELRLGWQRLRQGLCEVGDGLRLQLDSHGQYVARCRRLGDDIGRLRLLLQGLHQQLQEEAQEERPEESEEQMVGRWRKYTGVRSTLSAEESQVELLKAQLKELFRFSEDSHHLSDDVLAVVKEHQSVKCRVSRLCSDSESGLRSVLQDPLLLFSQWSLKVSQVLEASSEVTDFSHIAMLFQNIERLLRDGGLLRERLEELRAKGELLEAVFGAERSEGLQGELTASVKTRDLLHSQLMQRRSRLQGLISRTKDFGDTWESIRVKLLAYGERLTASDGPQPDILAKKSQADHFRVIQKDVEDCEADMAALETVLTSSPSQRGQLEKLLEEWKRLHRTAKAKVRESEENIVAHESFHDSLLNVEKWLMIMKQKLESFRGPSGAWSVQGRRHEAQKAVSEFPAKELQLQRMEVQGQEVLQRTSEDGRVHIVRDMTRLRESWSALQSLSNDLHRLLNSSDQTDSGKTSAVQHSPARAGETEEEEEEEEAGRRRNVQAHIARSETSGEVLLLPPQAGGGEEGGKNSSAWRSGYTESRDCVDQSAASTTEGQYTQVGGGGGDRRLGGGGGGGGGGGDRRLGGGGGDLEMGEISGERSSGRRRLEIAGGLEGEVLSSRGGVELGGLEGRGGGLEGVEGGLEGGGGLEIGGISGVRSSGRRRLEIGGGLEGEVLSSRGGVELGGLRSGGGLGGGGGEGGGGLEGRGGGGGLGGRGGGLGGGGLGGRGGGGGLGGRGGGLGGGGLGGRGGGGGGLGGGEGFVQGGEGLSSGGGLEGKGGGLEGGEGLSSGGGAFVAFRRDSAQKTSAATDQDATGRRGRFRSRRREFEAWLNKENELLSGVLSSRDAKLSSSETKSRQKTISALKAELRWGQEEFQTLLQEEEEEAQEEEAQEEGGGLEELRYRWMLYKSKLKDLEDVRSRSSSKKLGVKQESTSAERKQKGPGLLQRACRMALPFWLLLLALLLLALLLPLMEEGSSCSLSNNFARSFNIMLRYHGPPPT